MLVELSRCLWRFPGVSALGAARGGGASLEKTVNGDRVSFTCGPQQPDSEKHQETPADDEITKRGILRDIRQICNKKIGS